MVHELCAGRKCDADHGKSDPCEWIVKVQSLKRFDLADDIFAGCQICYSDDTVFIGYIIAKDVPVRIFQSKAYAREGVTLVVRLDELVMVRDIQTGDVFNDSSVQNGRADVSVHYRTVRKREPHMKYRSVFLIGVVDHPTLDNGT